MSDSKTSPSSGVSKNVKRNLPSWMSSREDESKSHGKKKSDVSAREESNEGETSKPAKGHGEAHKKNEGGEKSLTSGLGTGNFSKLLEGVVFVLSGFVNPERGALRSQALEMGGEYQPDWNSDCTLLVCAFPNTPKFRQVEADCGTIVSKEWISECYNQKKLVDIESYLMHAGKPWRRQTVSNEAKQDRGPSASRKSQKQVEKGLNLKPATSALSKKGAFNLAKDFLSPSKVKQWAINDLNKTISWLESQEESPEPSEIKKIAAEGILTCLQDAIDSLKQEQDIQQITEQWNFIPRVVEELAKLDRSGVSLVSIPKEDLYKQAKVCKQIYEVELGNSENDLLVKNKKPKTDERHKGGKGRDDFLASHTTEYDSDETIEMTEEEIGQAYNTLASNLSKC